MRAAWTAIAILLAPALVAAEPAAVIARQPEAASTADLRAGLGLVGVTSSGGTPAIRDLDAAGPSALIDGEVFVGAVSGVDLGFTLRYMRSATFETATGDGGELDTRVSSEAIGAIARLELGGGVSARARIEIGRSHLDVEPDPGAAVDRAELPGSDFRTVSTTGELAKRFRILRLAAGLELGAGFGLGGPAAEVAGAGAGVLAGGRLELGFALSESVDLHTAAVGRWLDAGDYAERRTRLEVGLGIRL